MHLTEACNNILDQITNVIEQISDEEFVTPVDAFNGSTLGQHFRHSLEFFQCLMEGYEHGEVCYDKRSHDQVIESSRELALEIIKRSQAFVSDCSLDKKIILQANYDPESNHQVEITSNMAREVMYNIEHVVHHMALVKIGVREVCSSVAIPDSFGIAVSTLKYRKKLEAN